MATAFRRHVVLTLAAALSACGVAGAERGFPLYAGAQTSIDQVATLSGPIGTVDGRDVADKGSSFELRAGCHVVTTKTDFFDHDATINIGATMGHHPSLTFAVPMKAGSSYVIEHHTQGLDGFSARPWLTARELDRSGTARDFEPTQDQVAIAACLGPHSARAGTGAAYRHSLVTMPSVVAPAPLTISMKRMASP
jgi:hypothetical protein